MEKSIKLQTHREAQALCGPHDEFLKLTEKEFKIKLFVRGDHLRLSGTAVAIKKAHAFIEYILEAVRAGQAELGRQDFHYILDNFKNPKKENTLDMPKCDITVSSTGRKIGPRTQGQREYVEAISKYDIVFGVGPAGTGKTYLAMAAAVEALRKQEVRRIILTRPAIEAGESLGFLPGDMIAKISPYLRPLYDAIYDMLEAERIEKYLETGIVEVAPLAYMRGRTLNDAFIILDEAQNCTAEQMKMFLTRLGFDSKAVITGDLTQSDLPEGKPIGLMQAQEILKEIEGIKFIYFTGHDVVRHALVQRIIEAYDKTSSR
ncbi:MAG: PhoH family protein [Candidatus Omnitrophica bacterium]|nr:PhoH family protein [Candidatus Omnitrophota bacterium]